MKRSFIVFLHSCMIFFLFVAASHGKYLPGAQETCENFFKSLKYFSQKIMKFIQNDLEASCRKMELGKLSLRNLGSFPLKLKKLGMPLSEI